MNTIIENFTKEYTNTKDINTTFINVSNLVIIEDLRKNCEQNYCGKYGTNWIYPHGVGPIKN
ncbi:hypothetical protein SH2C18_39820 [Clostridium sediminicola]|uniref:hypothetical protein n=1 Tax=Clostridium sediminicola TaxID=3114879 RepID=UPI0031F201B9